MISQLEVDYYSPRGRQYVTHSGRDEEELLPTVSNTKWIMQVFFLPLYNSIADAH